MSFVRAALVAVSVLVIGVAPSLPSLAADASFKAELISSTMLNPHSLTSADLDGDGDEDLIVTTITDNKVAWHENLGGGEYGPEQEIASGEDYSSSAVADLDGDGDLDVVVGTENDSGLVEWFRNLGGGEFEPGAVIAGEASARELVATADVDGDGNPDVIAAGPGGQIRVHLNTDGTGSFPLEETALAAGFIVSSIYPVDLDRNGRIDILVGGQDAGTNEFNLAWLSRSSSGWNENIIRSGLEARAVAGDMDQDGDLDVVAIRGNDVFWLENDPGGGKDALGGGGAFFPFAEEPIDTIELDFTDVAVADLNDDGRLDVVAASGEGLFYYPENGGFDISSAIADVVFEGAIRVADADRDGDLDILLTSKGEDRTSLVRNRKLHRSWLNVVQNQVDFTDSSTVATGDFNRDGLVDLVSTDTSSEEINYYENLGNGLFQERFTFEIIDDVQSVDVADFDGDGAPDVCSAAFGQGQLNWHPNDGFGPDGAEPITGFFVQDFDSIRAEDLDGDGDPDVIAGGELIEFATAFYNVTWWENEAGEGEECNCCSNGDSGLPGCDDQTCQDQVCATDTFCCDVEWDNICDAEAIAICSCCDGGGPGANWTGQPIAHLPGLVTGVDTADFDRDGDLDVVVGSSDFDCAEGDINWFRSSGQLDVSVGENLINRADDDTFVGNVFIAYNTPAGVNGRLKQWQFYDQETPGRLVTPLIFERFSSDSCLAAPATCVYVVRGIGTTRASAGGDSPQTYDFEPIPGSSDAVQENWFFGWKDGSPDTDPENAGAIDNDEFLNNEPLIYMEWGLPGSGPAIVQDGVIDNATWNFRELPPGRDYSVQFDVQGIDFVGETFQDNLDSPVYSVETVDVDGDGDDDVIVAHEDKLNWWENLIGEGDETDFGGVPHPIDDGFESWRHVEAADLDGDGDPDLIAASLNGEFCWFENEDGAGTFGPKQVIGGLDGGPQEITAADIDRDGDLDVVGAADSGERGLYWYRNDGGQFTLGTADLTPDSAHDGELVPLLALPLTTNGRKGDAVAELAELTLTFQQEMSPGFILTEDLNALIAELRIYRDKNENGQFDDGVDTLVEAFDTLNQDSGQVTLVLDEDDGDLIVANPATFLIVAELDANASQGAVDLFEVVHYLSDARLENSDNNDRLDPEPLPAPTFTSGQIAIEPRFDVNSTLDEPDANAGDGACASVGGNCTLRAAIEEANARVGDDLIRVPGGGLTTYTVNGVLSITDTFGNLTIIGDGPELTVIDGGGVDRVFSVEAGSALVLEGLTITNGDAPGGELGGGILAAGDLTVDNCVIDANSADGGGGLAVVGSSSSSVTGSTISNNSTVAAAGGGGILVAGGALELRDSLVTANTDGSWAGGIYLDGTGVLNLFSSTVSGNTGLMGGIYGNGAAPGSTIESSTIAANVGGGMAWENPQVVTMRNTIVSDNSGQDLDEIFNNYLSVGYNLVGNGAGVFVDGVNNDKVGQQSLLAPLADNGGPTLTHQLFLGSPAIDAGSCPGAIADQRGEGRPVDLTTVDNASGGDGCDIGAYESQLGSVTAPLEVPVRWCAVAGAPSIETPALVGAETGDDVLRQRLDRVNTNVFLPKAAMRFRSGATELVETFPILQHPKDPPFEDGDVVIDPETANFDEFLELIARCRIEWELLDPTVVGVTAVNINQFRDPDGNVLPILGLGGRAGLFNSAEQIAAGRLMVVDSHYRLNLADPSDVEDRLLGHELGHSVSLEHGNGIDDDMDDIVDNDDDPGAKFDGNNLMQYRDGGELSTLQVERARTHAFITVPDSRINLAGMLSDDGTIDPGVGTVLDFGFGTILDFELEEIQDFGMGTVLDFGFGTILDFGLGTVLDFGLGTILDFGFGTILDFGMVLGEDELSGEGTATLVSSTGGVFWPSPIRPNQKVLYYLNVDPDAAPATGGIPSDYGFPGAGVAVQGDIDLVVQVEISSSCSETACVDSEIVTVFRFIDAATGYVVDPDAVLPPTAEDPTVKSLTVGLVVEDGGDEVELDDQKMASMVRARIKSGVLVEAGAELGMPIVMETLSVVDCISDLPGGSSTIPIDCQCDDCAACPDFPGCEGDPANTPDSIPGEIVTDCADGEITVDPPPLPTCTPTPFVAEAGAMVEISTANFPAEGVDLQLFLDDDLLVSSFPSIPGTVTITVPPGTTASSFEITVDLVDPEGPMAQVAKCILLVNSNACGDADLDGCDDCSLVPPPGDTSNDGLDTDGDGLCDVGDPDDDNDGVVDENDNDPANPFSCAYTDADACDDCSSGGFDVFNDGADQDNDGLCDEGDTDDDNDGTDDILDPEEDDPVECGDYADGDGCDDCSSGDFDPFNDGIDSDMDGICSVGDIDDNDPNACGDQDADGCDDCSLGPFDPSNDGPDGDSDGICDATDNCTDNDGDGLGNGNLGNTGCIDPTTDSDDNDPFVCADTNNNVCDDCASGVFDPENDGIDTDEDGFCDALDNCPGIPNPAQMDYDQDGDGNLCDDCTDRDGDGVGQDFPTNTCGIDNCPGDPNPDQQDSDDDGQGDVCDPVFKTTLDLTLLWPPNHRMQTVNVLFEVGTSEGLVIELVEVTSTEPDNGTGDGDTVNDIQGAQLGTADTQVQLRSERSSGGEGRQYKLVYKATNVPYNEVYYSTAIVDVPHDQAGVTEPLMLTMESTPSGSVIHWDAVSDAVHYNVIRGELANIADAANQIDLGDVECLASSTTNLSLVDPHRPLPGEAYFYLVEYNDGWNTAYGTESAPKPRVPGEGACE